MREIRFRAWDKTEKVMIKNYAHSSQTGRLYVAETDYWDLVLMQYTGLKDKNGKEIYEGDLVLYRYYGYNGYKEKKFEEIGYIQIFQGAAFILKSENDMLSDWALLWSTINNSNTEAEISIEIIGNIYENSELLKKGE